ncbi:MAG: serine/threonine protein kinase [Holophagales bacterium]|nr:serine/threonine protein kinase [Holophagales bacterium]
MRARSDDDSTVVEKAIPESAGHEDRPTSVLPSDDEAVQGLRIGPYQVLRRLGEGGMGTVYLAARADQEFRKHVAIKVIRKGMASEEIVSRFRRERQILAALDHPGIAKLFDGGTTEDGLSYFVMEYIQGRPLGDYCDSHGLSIRERLLIFRSICSAVQYAHQNLVIHRDLKPANILVTADGAPKLLDFGIAKLLNPDALSLEAPETATGMHVMTPAYASPEQVRSDPLTTASDVYSLGVVLYELLTGRRPYELKTGSQLEVYRVVCEEEPSRPSTVVTGGGEDSRRVVTSRGAGTPQKLNRLLRGDLDNIVMMAMRKEPQRRYGSVQALSDDIGRYLDGYPVSAHKASWSYRAGKYVRLHAGGVSAVATVFLLLLAFAVTAAVQNARIRRERDTADQVTSLLVSLFDVNDPETARGEKITAREILDRGARRIEGELRDQPEVRARLLSTIGDIYGKLGLFDQAQPLLDESLRIRKSLYARDDASVVESLQGSGRVLAGKGQYGEAEKRLREALAMQKRLKGEGHPDVAGSLAALASVLEEERKLDEAEALLREALAIHRKALGNGHHAVATDLSSLALVLTDKGRLDEAEKLHREAVAIDRSALGADHPGLAADLSNLATALFHKGELDEAEQLFRQALAINRKALGDEHPTVATGVNNVAIILFSQGRLDEAETLYREAVAIHRKALGDEHPAVAQDLNNLALVLLSTGRLDEAEKLLRDALAIDRKALGEEHPTVAIDRNNLAGVLLDKGRPQEAEPLFRSALAINSRVLGEHHPAVATNMTHLAETLLAQGDPEEAAGLLNAILAFPTEMLPTDHKSRAGAKSLLGACLTAQRKYPEAERMLLDAWAAQTKPGIAGRGPGRTHQRILDLYKAWGRPDEAEAFRKRSPLPSRK